MNVLYNKIFLIIIFEIVVLIKADYDKTQGRNVGYYPLEEEHKTDYQIFQYPPDYHLFNNGLPGCDQPSIDTIMGKGLNFILLKLGIFGVIKAFAVFVLISLLIKLPILLLKFGVLKSFFLPVLFTPLLFQYLTNYWNQSEDEDMNEKPEDTSNTEDTITQPINMKRNLDYNLTSKAWETVKIFAESDQCLEKIACTIGASDKDSSAGMIFSRAIKFLYNTAPPSAQKRLSQIRKAYAKGKESTICSEKEYACHSPQLLIQQGLNKIKIL